MIKKSIIPSVLIVLLSAFGCSLFDSNDQADINDLSWSTSIANQAGQDVRTITVGDTVILALNIINLTSDDIEIVYDSCNPCHIDIKKDNTTIWTCPQYYCNILKSKNLAPGDNLEFQYEWTADRWNNFDQGYQDIEPGTYEFQVGFTGYSSFDRVPSLSIYSSTEFTITDR